MRAEWSIHRLGGFLLLCAVACAQAGDDPADVPALAVSPVWRVDADAADLTQVTAVAVSPDGEFAIAQPQDDQVRILSRDGAVRSVGRDGAGPGEFRFPSRVGYAGDQLYVVDPALYRVSLFTATDSLLATFDEPRTVAVDGQDQIGLEMNLQAVLPDGLLRMLVTRSRGAAAPAWAVDADSGVTWLIRIDMTGDFERLLTPLPVNRCQVRIPNGERMWLTSVPFCAPPLHTGFDGGELVALVDQDQGSEPSYRVRLMDGDGAVMFDVARRYEPLSVPQMAIDSMLAEDAAARERAARPRPAAPPPAATLPPVQRVLVGRDSTVWLELEERLPEHTWLILDRHGVGTATLSLPVNLQLAAVRGDRIWAFEVGPDGLQSVVMMRLER